MAHSPLTKKEDSLIDELIPSEEFEHGLCKECNQPNSGSNIGITWCRLCNSKHFQQDFKNWTSGNPEIDEFIQKYQLEATNPEKILEWIPYDKLTDIEYIAKGGFGDVYKARWIDGQILSWNIEANKWKRRETIPNGLVALKILNYSQNIKADFLQEITRHKLFGSDGIYLYDGIVRCHGISQEPKTQNYIMVMGYVPNGDIRQILKNNRLNFRDKLGCLYHITLGLKSIHKKGLMHRDFHSGNILYSINNLSYITDLGLCRPANEEDKKENIYGVLPYVAPEVLRGKQYSQAADIYSWGIVACEILSGLPPYHELAHEEYLALKICQGVRPKFVNVPQLLKDLIMRCLDANPIIRPTASELVEFFLRSNSELCRQYNDIEEAEETEEFKEELSSKSNSLAFRTHPQAIYTSRLLDYKNLPEPQNSKEVNEQFYNSIEYSKSLQIDFVNIQGNNN